MRSIDLKKIAVILIICTFVLGSMLVGCGGGSDKPGNPTPAGGADTRKTDNGIKPFPLTGKANVPKSGSITVTVWDFQKCPKEMGDMTNNVWTKWINENCPVDVKFVPITRWGESTLIRQKFAAGTAPDYVLVYDITLMKSLYNQKMLYRLNDLVEKNSTQYKKVIEPYMNQVISKSTTEAGDMFAFVRIEEPSLQDVTPCIRVDWLKKLGLEKPTTPEEFLEVCKAFANKDPDGNGKNDTFGFNLAEPGHFFLESSFGIPEAGTKKWRPYAIENDKMLIPWDRIKDYVTLMKQLYDAGVVDRDFVVDRDGSKAQQDYLQGKLGIAHVNNMGDKELMRTFINNNPGGRVEHINKLKTKYGQFGLGVRSNVGLVAVMNAKAKNPEGVMKYVDFCATEEYARFMQLGVEGRHFEYKANKRGIRIINKDLTDKEFEAISWEYRHNKMGILIKDVSNPMFRYDVKDPVDRVMYENTLMGWQWKGFEVNQLDHGYPMLPKELNTKEGTMMKKSRELIFSCVTTKSYTVDQFFADIQVAWKKNGGPEILQYYNDWYTKYKDRIITTAETNKQPLPELLPIEELLKE